MPSRFGRPAVTGRKALLVGFTKQEASFCRSYRLVARIAMPVENEERGRPLARCALRTSLARAWPRLIRSLVRTAAIRCRLPRPTGEVSMKEGIDCIEGNAHRAAR